MALRSSRTSRLVRLALAIVLTGSAAGPRSVEAATITIASWFTLPNSVAVDPSGNVFVTDSQAAYEFSAADDFTTYKAINLSFEPDGIAFDSAGNMFLANAANSFVYEMPAPDY